MKNWGEGRSPHQANVTKPMDSSKSNTYLYLWWHSAGITNRVDHVTDGSNPGSTGLWGFTRDFHPVLSPSCVAEDSRPRERFQAFLECRGLRLQLVSSSFSTRARRCGQEEVPDELTLRTSRSVAKLTKFPLDELSWYACEAEVAPQFHRLYAIFTPHV